MTVDVDFDRLADFVGGVLDGTPDADRVRDLIASDAAWQAAYTDLMAADVTVRADLAAYGAHPADLPPDVADRLDDLFRTLAVDAVDGPVAAPGRRADAARPASARRDAARPGGRRATRRARLVAVLSAAAAVIAVGFGLFVLIPQAQQKSDSASDLGAAAPANQPGAEGGGGVRTQSEPVVTSSGRDYRPGGFGPLAQAAVPPQLSATTPGKAVSGTEDQRDSGFAPVPSVLTRLVDAAARATCLAAVTARHGGVPRTVDFAAFLGRPAVVILLDGSLTGGGVPWVVVVGSGCGQPAGQIDERYNGPLT